MYLMLGKQSPMQPAQWRHCQSQLWEVSASDVHPQRVSWEASKWWQLQSGTAPTLLSPSCWTVKRWIPHGCSEQSLSSTLVTLVCKFAVLPTQLLDSKTDSWSVRLTKFTWREHIKPCTTNQITQPNRQNINKNALSLDRILDCAFFTSFCRTWAHVME